MSADPFQILTLFFGIAVLVSVVTDYNNYTNSEDHTQQIIQTVKSSLAFFFAAYALLTSETRGKQAEMYKNLILGLSIFAWVVVVANPAGAYASPLTSWQQVAQNSAAALAQGSFVALPIVFLAWP